MLDYERIVEDVRSAMYTATPEHLDLLRAAAADYSVACDEVNDRLRTCNGLLKKGLVSEAIRQCEIEPNLLDAVATLDFSEQEQWRQMLLQCEIVAPTPLLLDVAGDLNEAYASSRSVDVLMQQHRLSAIARSPLRLRLEVLRKLAEAEPDNSFWKDDVEVFEEERQKHIQKEAIAAAKAGDVGVLRALDHELHSARWLQHPSPSLLALTRKHREQLEQHEARIRLQKISTRLNEAYAAFEVETARSVRTEWHEALENGRLDVDDPLYLETAPALEWLDEQDAQELAQSEHERGLAKLEQALNRRVKAKALEKAYRAATGPGHEIPLHLETRYKRRMHDLRVEAKRKMVLAIAGVVAAVLLIVGIATWLIAEAATQRKVKQHEQAVKVLIDEGKWQEAHAYLQDLDLVHPHLAGRPEIQKLIAQVESHFLADKERNALFSRLVERVRSDVQSPDYQALDRLREMVITEDEKDTLARLEAKIRTAKTKRQEQVDASFQEQLDALRDRLTELDELSRQSTNQLQESLTIFESELNSLNVNSGSVSSGLRQQTKPLWVRLNAIKESLNIRGREEVAKEDLDQVINNPDRYHMTLRKFVEQFPTSRRAGDLKKVLYELDLWKGMATWDALLDKAANHNMTRPRAIAAARFAPEVENVLRAHGDFPAAATMKYRLDHWKRIARRQQDEPLVKQIRSRFEKPWVRDFWTLVIKETRAGDPKQAQRYYLRNPLNTSPTRKFFFRYVKNFKLEEAREKFDPERGETLLTPSVEKAPQVALYNKVDKELDGISDENWEECIYHIVEHVIDAKEVEPLLRLSLASSALEFGCQGSFALEMGFSAYRQELKAARVDPFANWLDPNNVEADDSRKKAARVLDGMGGEKLKAAGRAVKKERDKFWKPLPPRYQWIGWLDQELDGTWKSRPQLFNEQPRDAYCVTRDESRGTVEIIKIGQLRSSKLELDPEKPMQLLVGRPVYVMR